MIKNFDLKSLYPIRYQIISFIILSLMFIGLAVVPEISMAQATTTPISVQITSTPSSIPLCEITRVLKTGSSGEDVRCLQRFLNWAGYGVATVGAGSPGSESTYFGVRTAEAVARWQNANASQVLAPAGLTVGTGNFGTLSFNYYVKVVRTSLGLPQ